MYVLKDEKGIRRASPWRSTQDSTKLEQAKGVALTIFLVAVLEKYDPAT